MNVRVNVTIKTLLVHCYTSDSQYISEALSLGGLKTNRASSGSIAKGEKITIIIIGWDKAIKELVQMAQAHMLRSRDILVREMRSRA